MNRPANSNATTSAKLKVGIEALASDFIAIITALANDLPLAEKHRDHALTGDWKDQPRLSRQARLGVDLPQAG